MIEPGPQTDPLPGDRPYETAHVDHVATAIREMKHPTQIGPYHILSLIGEGGMGSVYRAEQRHPIRRLVALKVIKLGMDTRQVIARFESERQALALMNHPNVAKVLEAGATDTGRPYFVMEYVSGEPITAFADRHKLTTRQRLELFIQACEAIQHAHQKAIIHRDLKPSNILVTLDDRPGSSGLVKVIDFGVAKAISRPLTEKTLFTETGQMVGTPEYMSPEQAEMSGLDVDTRTDVYSLGVVLYELLTGALPFEPSTLRSAGYNEIQRMIRETDPPRPSTRLSSLGPAAEKVAERRRMQLSALEYELRSELEWVPLKAMRKDRSDRYATATELAQDIQNYLENRPLLAGPESTTYRLRKFLRRNKRGVAGSAAMVLLLLSGIVATTWQAIRATHAEARTRAASEELREVNRFLTEDLLASASPQVTRGREMSVREAVDRAAEAVERRFRDSPMSEAAVRAVLADTYDKLGETARGLPHAQAAVELLRQQRGFDDEQTIDATQMLSRLLSKLNRHSEAEPMARDALNRAQRKLGDSHPVTLDSMGALAMTLRIQGRFDEAEPLYRRLLEDDRRVHGPQTEQTAQSLNNLAVLLNTVGRADEAESLYRESLAIRRTLLGEDHPSYLSSLSNLARVLENQKKIAAAESLHREVLAAKRRVLKDDHPDTMLSVHNLASVLVRQEKYEEAEKLHRENLARRTRVLGGDDIDALQTMNNLAALLMHTERAEEGGELLEVVVEKRKKVLGPKHPHTLGAMAGLSLAYSRQKRFQDALPLLATVCEPDALETFAVELRPTLVAHHGCCLARVNQFARAEPVLLDALERLREANQLDGIIHDVFLALAAVCENTNRPDEAANWRSELAALAASTQPATRPGTQPAARPATGPAPSTSTASP